MSSFIAHLIHDSIGNIQQPTDLQDQIFVFPTKRAGKFFENELAKHAKKKPLWVPQIMSIADFFRYLYENFAAPQHIVIPPAKAVFELFLCYKNYEPEVDFDSFYTWGQLVLKDFDEIDKFLAPTDQLFVSIKDIKDLDETFAIPDDQLAFIKEFWRVLDKKNNTDMEREFIRIWEILGQVYPDFKQTLLQKKYAYEGMAQKIILEQLTQGTLHLPFKRIVWAGFNALSATEKMFVEYITQPQQQGFVYWDTDRYYMDDEQQEAGFFLRQYYQIWKNHPRHNWKAQTNLTTARKQIRVGGIPLKVGQAKYTGQLLEQIVDQKVLNMPETTIVLGDENLLVPTLYALPTNVEQVNITMGYPLRNTPLFQLLEQVVQLHKSAQKNNPNNPDEKPLYYTKVVIQLLNNPFIKSLAKEKTQQSIAYIGRNNKIRMYPESIYRRFFKPDLSDNQQQLIIEQLQQHKIADLPQHLYEAFIHPIFAILFKDISQANIYPIASIGIIEVFEKILKILYQSATEHLLSQIDLNQKVDEQDFETTENSETNSQEPPKLPIEAEFMYNMVKHLHALEDTLRDYRQIVTLDTFWKLFKQILQDQKLDFIGEPLRGLQLMGFLETRVLDFKNIILLSLNEGVIPATKNNPTFIPFNLRRAFGMPTTYEQDAIAAYNFYRLLQRAENIYLLYNTEVNSMGDQEKSRFLLQIENELLPRNPNINYMSKIIMPPLNMNPTNLIDDQVLIPKTPDIIQLLDRYLVQNPPDDDTPPNNKRLAPTAIHTYLNCPMEFYWRYIAQLQTSNDADLVMEELNDRIFGNILHRTIELLYKPFHQFPITVSFVDKLLANQKLIDRNLNKAFEDNQFDLPKEGKNVLLKRVLARLVRKILEIDRKDAPFQLIGLETHDYVVDFPLSDGRVVGLKGTIDRIDRINIPNVGECYRILDYKTGEVKINNTQTALKADLPTYFGEYFANPDYKAGFQVYLYAYLFWASNQRTPLLKGGLYALKQVNQGILYLRNGQILTNEMLEAFEIHLRALLDSLFDPQTPFIQTADVKERYEYSSFKGLF